MEPLHREACCFVRYLVQTTPSAAIQQRYAEAVGDAPVSRRDETLLALARRRPRTIGLLDAGLALADPHAELRRRLHLAFAILESTPELHDRFLPVDRPPAYALVVAFAGLRAAVKGAAGVLLLRVAARG